MDKPFVLYSSGLMYDIKKLLNFLLVSCFCIVSNFQMQIYIFFSSSALLLQQWYAGRDEGHV